jgi:hypothetical protein
MNSHITPHHTVKWPLARSIHMPRFSGMHLDPSWMQLWRVVQNCKDRMSPNEVGRSRPHE